VFYKDFCENAILFSFFLRNSFLYRKEESIFKTPSPALPLKFRGRELATDSGLGFVSLELQYRDGAWGTQPAK